MIDLGFCFVVFELFEDVLLGEFEMILFCLGEDFAVIPPLLNLFFLGVVFLISFSEDEDKDGDGDEDEYELSYDFARVKVDSVIRRQS